MRYLTMVKTLNPQRAGSPPPDLMTAILALGVEAGPRLLESGGMALAGSIVTRAQAVVTDGPFAESKELVGGYAFYELDSDATAMSWAQRFMDLHRRHWPQWEGEITILRLETFPNPA